MLGDGAQDDLMPQVAIKSQKSVRDIIRNYFTAICILFLMIILLCLNNLTMYRSYRETRQLLEDIYRKANIAEAGKPEQDSEPNNTSGDKEKILEGDKELKESLNTLTGRNNEIVKQIQELKKKNDELTTKNQQLLEDNIELQNTLKKAAAAGIKPQSYTNFRGLSSRGELERGTYLGKFLGTAYTPSWDECGNNEGITNSGEPIIPGISVAIDTKFWPFGTVFYIRGLGYAVAMDTGSAIKGKYRFDFAVFDKKFASNIGTQYWDVYLLKLGDGAVRELAF